MGEDNPYQQATKLVVIVKLWIIKTKYKEITSLKNQDQTMKKMKIMKWNSQTSTMMPMILNKQLSKIKLLVTMVRSKELTLAERKKWSSATVLGEKHSKMVILLSISIIMTSNRPSQIQRLYIILLRLKPLRLHSQMGFKCLSSKTCRSRSISVTELKKLCKLNILKLFLL